jgi:hypothetical protein
MDILKIIITALATIAAFYVTSSILLAQKQLVAATRLSGYLTYWQNWIIENGYSRVYALGLLWTQEEEEIRKRGGGPADLIKLQAEKKKRLSDVRQLLEKDFQVDSAGLVEVFSRFPKESVPGVLESSKITRQNLIDGKTFISDEEAATLGVAFAHKSIELKMGIIDLIDGGTNFAVTLLTAPAEFDIKKHSKEISELLWKGILVSRNIDLIAKAARVISSKSVLALAIQNIVAGKRLTKR